MATVSTALRSGRFQERGPMTIGGTRAMVLGLCLWQGRGDCNTDQLFPLSPPRGGFGCELLRSNWTGENEGDNRHPVGHTI